MKLRNIKDVLYFFNIQEALFLNISRVFLYTNEGWWPLAYCKPRTFGFIVCSQYLKRSIYFLPSRVSMKVQYFLFFLY